MKIRIADENDKLLVFKLRTEVFVKEQNVPLEIELDSEYETALHIIAEENETAIGCARIIFDKTKAHIGRLAVKKEYRGKGIGHSICKYIIEYCHKSGYKNIWLNSQTHAVDFYKKIGFIPQGDVFYEAGIEHIKMEINNT